MKTVNYTSNSLLDCARCGGQAIICLDQALTVLDQSYIAATVAAYQPVWSNCGTQQYRYDLSYDENQLIDPTYSLVSTDVLGVLCGGCLVDYINARTEPSMAYILSLLAPYFDHVCLVTTEAEFTAAIANADCNHIVVGAPFAITANRTVPATKALTVLNGCPITATAHVLTIQGAFSSGVYQCFVIAAAGEVLFDSYNIERVLPQWFGAEADGTGDSTLAINAAIVAAANVSAVAELSGQVAPEIFLTPGRFVITDTIEVLPNVCVRGSGKLNSIVSGSLAAGTPLIKFAGSAGGQTHSTVKSLTISGNKVAGSLGIEFWDGTGGATQNNFSRLVDCYITRCDTGVRLDSTAAGNYIIYCDIENCDFGSDVNVGFNHIQIGNGVNYLRIFGCHFFGTNGRAVKVDNTFFGNYLDITGNSMDCVNGSDGSAILIQCAAGVVGVTACIQRNRLEAGGIVVSSDDATVQIYDNYVVDAPRGVYVYKGKDCEIRGNTLVVGDVDILSNYQYAIDLGTPVRTKIGRNSYGTFGTTSFSPDRFPPAGTDTIFEREYHNGITAYGTHEQGDELKIAGAPAGVWTRKHCVQAGTVNAAAVPTTGTVTALDLNHITLANPAGYCRGSYITIAGIADVKKIKSITGAVALLTTACSGPVAGVAVAISAPVYVAVSRYMVKGDTASRPTMTTEDVGGMYMDTDLDADGKPIWWNGVAWVDATGAVV